ncbi:copper amine oxidase N-terminal domain-containing protein [Crassaminicella thermophila]|uniref:Copper amine oxidase N-terminal domain-containing protein n=1 Tax=Crassaminicella thermophila TaxID=2599308 RepID=A0A5C0SGZ7_CRATE|nr:copper amine oxidase N-terminal domain-containing protein [Crassaminicella thermophila]QEK13252.1 copper amine oxidase N-terminal domain-containing protein [Crassaminicella thermophila]
MKRKLSLLLVLALMISLVPMSAFAGSDNSLTKVITVKEDADLGADAPVLKIENDGGDWAAKEVIELTLDNAEWKDTITATVEGTGSVAVERKSDTKAVLTVTNAAKGTVVKVTLDVDFVDNGAAKVEVTSKSGAVTEGTYTFAKVTDGNTLVTIEDTITFADKADMENIEIEETVVGTVYESGLKYIKLTLDKDFEFDYDAIQVTGDLINGTLDKSAVTEVNDYTIKIDVEDALKNVSYLGDITISGLKVNPTRDADEGTVYVKVSSNVSEIETTKLEVGKYAEYDVEVKADGDALEIFSGRYESAKDEAHELQKLIIEENVAGSLVDGRTVYVEFPEWVKIRAYDSTGDAITDVEIDENVFEFEITKATDKKVELTFYVSVEAGKSGDIEAKVESRGLEKDYEVVLGKAIAPVEVKVDTAKLKAGVRNQEIGTITITETDAEAIQEGKIVVELDKDLEFDGEPTVEVTKGDLEIDDVDVLDNGYTLEIEVDNTSDEASTIVIKDAKVKVDRSIAEGAILAEVKGDALYQNDGDADDQFDNDYYAEIEVANVITPADDDTKAAAPAKFVIGKAEYQVGDEVRTADVAPYITDGRTMLSLRYVAEAVGVSDENIMWDGTTRTVTIFKGDRIAQVQIGSNKLFVNGAVVPMDTVAVIKDGRTMLPVRFVAQALGAEVEWDGATRTVTIK